MKQLFIFIAIQLITIPSFCQQIEAGSHEVSKDLLAKSKKQKNAGSILTGLGTGTLLLVLLIDGTQQVGGELVNAISLGTIPKPENKSYAAGYITGAALLVGGISLLSASSKNKKKATNLSLQNQASIRAFRGNLMTTNIPSLTLKISL